MTNVEIKLVFDFGYPLSKNVSSALENRHIMLRAFKIFPGLSYKHVVNKLCKAASVCKDDVGTPTSKHQNQSNEKTESVLVISWPVAHPLQWPHYPVVPQPSCMRYAAYISSAAST